MSLSIIKLLFCQYYFWLTDWLTEWLTGWPESEVWAIDLWSCFSRYPLYLSWAKLTCVLFSFYILITNYFLSEKKSFLPNDIAAIVRKMIEIRLLTFTEAKVRDDEDYRSWQDRNVEHPTMFYPYFPLFRHPKSYCVSGKNDSDLCHKPQSKKRDFSHGLFTVGCSCPKNITYGFELMLQPESEHNLFRFIMCRDITMTGPHKLHGIIYDNACNLDQYLLNREPREFEHIRVLVDGSHWVI